MSIKYTAAFVCALAASVAHAGPEESIKAAVETAIGNGSKVEGVTKTPYLGLYEVRIGGEILYTDEKANYLILGEILDAKTRQNITQQRVNQLSGINFAELPLDLAIKQVRGTGKRVIATFEDPNCGYCKKLAKELAVNGLAEGETGQAQASLHSGTNPADCSLRCIDILSCLCPIEQEVDHQQ